MKLTINNRCANKQLSIRPARASTLRVCASAEREAALKEMEKMRQGLSAHLASTEVALKSSGSSSFEDIPKADLITSVGQEDYWEFVKAAPAEQVVVVDHYTTNCGPCKMVYPKVVDMAERYQGRAAFAKFLCSKENRELGVQLGIKVAPTFILYKGGRKVAEMTGAKADKLEELLKEAIGK